MDAAPPADSMTATGVFPQALHRVAVELKSKSCYGLEPFPEHITPSSISVAQTSSYHLQLMPDILRYPTAIPDFTGEDGEYTLSQC
jgi:hypothetical protein